MARHAGVVTQFKRHRRKGGALHCDVCGWFPPVGLARITTGLYTMMHAHHVVPVACGGADNEVNLVLLCPNCHSIAHRLGTISPAKDSWPEFTWNGPRTKNELLGEMDLLIMRPREWEEREDRRRAKRLEDEAAEREKERLAKNAAEEPEAIARRSGLKIVRGAA